MLHNPIKIKKHKKIAVPLLSILTNEIKGTKTRIKAIIPGQGEKEVEATSTITLFYIMEEEEFLNSPFKEKYTPIFSDNLNINKLTKTAEFKEAHNRIKKASQKRIIEETKKHLKKAIKHLSEEARKKGLILRANSLEELIEKINKATEIETIKKIIQRAETYADKPERVKRNFYINLLNQKKKSPINPQKRVLLEEIKQKSELLFKKLIGDDLLTLVHLKIVTEIVMDNVEINNPSRTRGGSFISKGQTTFVKPFEFLMIKEDFINLIQHIADSQPHKTKETIESYLNLIKKIKSNEQKLLQKQTKDAIELINATTKKNFKRLRDALKYIFSEEFSGNIDKKTLLIKRKETEYDSTRYLAEILDHFSKEYHKTIIKNNTTSSIYNQIPGVIRKMKGLYYYIENKEETISKITIRKTLERLQELEEEINNIKEINSLL